MLPVKLTWSLIHVITKSWMEQSMLTFPTENNNAANLPPTLEQILMMQAQMLQTM
jgi:hypothetical protein